MTRKNLIPHRSILATGLLSIFLTGCATFSADGGLDNVSAMTKERTGQDVRFSKPTADTSSTTSDAVNQLLAKPLTPDTAVQIALANNKSLQASFAELFVRPHARWRGRRNRAKRHVRLARHRHHAISQRYRKPSL
jgi:hypothetical protein